MRLGVLGAGSLALLLARPASGQKEIKATTTGTCSPVVTGGSSQITINCNGLSAARANQLVTLMNRILAERLDLSAVNTKLDQLQSDLGGLNAALRPLANAPPPVLALLKQSEILTTQCSNLMSDWSEHSNEALQAASRATRDAMKARMEARNGALAAAGSADEDQRRGQDFSREYAPKLTAINGALHRLMPDAPAVPDVAVPTSPTEAGQYAFQVDLLCLRYRARQRDQRQPENARLVNDMENVFQGVTIFDKAWTQAQLDKRHADLAARAPRSDAPSFSDDAKARVNNQESEKYRTMLEPKLVSLRDKLLPQVPAFSSGRDYAAVGSVEQLGGVCTDVNQLAQAFRRKVTEDLQNQKKTSVEAQ